MAVQDDYKSVNFYIDNSKEVSDGFASFKEEGGEYYFAYKMKNKVFLLSEGYSSDRARNNGIQSVEKNLALKDRFKIMDPENGKHYFVLKAGNNQEIAKSIYFNSVADTESAISNLSNSVKGGSLTANISIDKPLPPKTADQKKKRKKRSATRKPSPEKTVLEEGQYHHGNIAYQIFKSSNDKFYFTFRTPDDKAILLNANVNGFKTLEDAKTKITEVLKYGLDQKRYEGKTTRNGKYYFYLKNEEGKSIAKSFFFDSTENMQNAVGILSSNKFESKSENKNSEAKKVKEIKTDEEKKSLELKKLNEEVKAKEATRIAELEKVKEEKVAAKAELERVKAEQERKEKLKKTESANSDKTLIKKEDKPKESKVEATDESAKDKTIEKSNISAADDLMATLGRKENLDSKEEHQNAAIEANKKAEQEAKLKEQELIKQAELKAAKDAELAKKAAAEKQAKEAAEKAEAEKKIKELELKQEETKRKAEAEAAALKKVEADKAAKLKAKVLADEKANEIQQQANKQTEKKPLVFGNNKKEAEPLVFGDNKKTEPLTFGKKEDLETKNKALSFGEKKEAKVLEFGSSKDGSAKQIPVEVTNRKFPWWLIPLLLIPLLIFFLWKGCFSGAANKGVVASKEKTTAVTKTVKEKAKATGNAVKENTKAAADKVVDVKNKTKEVAKNASTKIKETSNKVVEKVTETNTTAAATTITSVSQFEKGTIEYTLNNCINDNNCNTPASLNWGETNYSKNSARMSANATGSINNLALLMNTYPNITLAIYGHISNNESDYIENSNTSLSERRAKKMYDSLVTNGVPSNRLSYQGMGNSNPLSYEDTANAHYKNRRTEVVLTTK